MAASIMPAMTISSVGVVVGTGGDTLSGIEFIIGSNFADRLEGSIDAEEVDGGVGDDELSGGRGDDT